MVRIRTGAGFQMSVKRAHKFGLNAQMFVRPMTSESGAHTGRLAVCVCLIASGVCLRSERHHKCYAIRIPEMVRALHCVYGTHTCMYGYVRMIYTVCTRGQRNDLTVYFVCLICGRYFDVAVGISV